MVADYFVVRKFLFRGQHLNQLVDISRHGFFDLLELIFLLQMHLVLILALRQVIAISC
jgi:hypothetical protein